jgi:peptide/nickel transport system permease protein
MSQAAVQAPARMDAAVVTPVPRRVTRGSYALRHLRRSRLAVAGLVVLALVAICGLFSPALAPHSPTDQGLERKLKPPVWEENSAPGYVLGTDHLGRDMLSRLIWGARVSLIVGICAVALSGTVGVVLGLLSGYYRGRFEMLIMGLTEVQLAFPFILLAIAIVSVLGGGLLNVIVVLAIAGWPPYARIVNGSVLSVKEREYVQAARTIGAGDRRILRAHVLPNIIAPVIVIATFAVATTIISEATLTFLGLGVEPRTPTWGTMLADGRAQLTNAWWPATFPGLAIMFTVLSVNLVGDWLRDVLDPTMRNV